MQDLTAALYDSKLLEAHRTSATSFSRNRKLSFVTVIAWFLSGVRAAVQTELDVFFALVNERCELLRHVTAQALSKARQGFRAKVFDALNAALIQSVQQHLAVPLWRGLRVVAVDGSDLRLTSRCAAKRCITKAKVFGMYLPGLEMMLHATLYDEHTGERQMLFEQMDHVAEADLVVLDRGFCAAWVAALFQQRGRFFCVRADSVGGNVVRDFLRSGLSQAVVDLPVPKAEDVCDYDLPEQRVRVRLIRVLTLDGQIRIFMTNLLDEQRYPAQAFSDLYHQRWRIEEAFKRIKSRLNLESVSGLSWLTHTQDLGAKIICDNLNSLCCLQALEQVSGEVSADAPSIVETESGKHYKINRTRAFSAVKRCMPRWLQTGHLPTPQEIDALLKQLASNLVEFVADRMRPREMPKSKPHHAFACKSVG